MSLNGAKTFSFFLVFITTITSINIEFDNAFDRSIINIVFHIGCII